MRAEIEGNPLLEIVAEAHELPFGADGNLPFGVFTGSHSAEPVAAH
jgi:hypothetical protein